LDIKFEQKEPSFGLLTLKVEPVDYQNEVTNQIKEYAKTVQLKGFRKGKAPLGMVKKMVGKDVKFEAINKAASNALTQYIKDSEHDIIGMPLSYLDETLPPFNNEDFYFSFKLGFTPEFDINISDKVTVDEYEVEITDEMVNETIERMSKQFEDTTQVDVAEAGDFIAGKVTEKEGNFEVDTLIPLKRVAESQLPLFVGLTKEDTVEFDLSEAFPDAKQRSLALGIKEEEAEKLSHCHFAVTDITRTSAPKMDAEFFKKATGEDLETEEDFRNKVRDLIHVPHKENSDMLLNYDIRTAVLGASNLKISEEFTKAWFDHLQRSADEKQPIKASDYTSYVEQLHWEIITGKLAKEHDLKVSEDELKDEARKFAKKLFAQMGMGSVPEEQLDNIAQMYLDDEKGEQKAKLRKDAITEKTFTLIKSQITLNQHVISSEEYTTMMDKRNKEIEEKFNQTTEETAVEAVEEKSAE
jgi:trigger factor